MVDSSATTGLSVAIALATSSDTCRRLRRAPFSPGTELMTRLSEGRRHPLLSCVLAPALDLGRELGSELETEDEHFVTVDKLRLDIGFDNPRQRLWARARTRGQLIFAVVMYLFDRRTNHTACLDLD